MACLSQWSQVAGAFFVQFVLLPVSMMMMMMMTEVYGGAHVPEGLRSFATIAPIDAANFLRECVREHGEHMNQTQFLGDAEGWAGHVLYDPARAPGVVAGPLIPKSMSSTLRKIYGNINRPIGLASIDQIARLDTPHQLFWFAVVRDPLTRFIDAYVEAGNGQRSFTLQNDASGGGGGGGGPDDDECNFAGQGHHNATNFCAQSAACRREHFENWVFAHEIGFNGQIHRMQQMYWLAFANVHLDAVFRLERLADDWEDAASFADEHSCPAATDKNASSPLTCGSGNFSAAAGPTLYNMLASMPPRVRAKTTRLEMEHDACQEWADRGHLQSTNAFYQLLQDNALQWLQSDIIQRVCRYLLLDYVCLRYALPVQCQLMVGDEGHVRHRNTTFLASAGGSDMRAESPSAIVPEFLQQLANNQGKLPGAKAGAA